MSGGLLAVATSPAVVAPAEAPWGDGVVGRLGRGYLSWLAGGGLEKATSERGTLRALVGFGEPIPLLVLDGTERNTVNLSFRQRFVRQALQGVAKMEVAPWKKVAMRTGLRALGGLLAVGGADRVVHVGAWPQLRNFEPHLDAEQTRALTSTLARAFPGHALVFSALNPVTHADLLATLGEVGWARFPTAHTRFMGPNVEREDRGARQNHRRDGRLLEQHGYAVVDASPEPGLAARLHELYRKLNREKYATNVELGEAWFERAIRDPDFHVRLLVKDGRVDAFYAFTIHEGVVWNPAAGYDTSVPQERGLYRMLAWALRCESLSRGLAMETGAGADAFKRGRGDKPVPRFAAVYAEHLGWHRRVAFRALGAYAAGPYAGATRAHVRKVDGEVDGWGE